jgi:hypothetical protein
VFARGLRALATSTPHTLRAQYQRGPVVVGADISILPDVVVRTLTDPPSPDPPGFAAFQLQPGATVVLLNRAALDGVLSAKDVAFAAGLYTSPGHLADRLAQLVISEDEAPHAAIAVLRYDAIDVPATIERLIDAYEPEPRYGAALKTWAHQVRALPITFATSPGPIYGLRRDCSVVAIGALEAHASATWRERSPIAHAAALIGASRLVPELRALAPARPLDALPCPACAPEPRAELPRGCAQCWYLGWQLPDAPAWFRSDLPVGPPPPF